MKIKLLFATTALSLATVASAQSFEIQQTRPVQKQIAARGEKGTVLKSRKLAPGVTEKEIVLGNGVHMKMATAVAPANNVINPEVKAKTPAKVSAREGFVLYEDFESWDKDTNPLSWLPEGWSKIRTVIPTNIVETGVQHEGWKMTYPYSIYDIISSNCVTFEMWGGEADEMLVTPEFKVSSGMDLTWMAMPQIYFYEWDSSKFEEMSTKVFTTDDIINDITVNVSTDGGETWTPIFSHAEDWLEVNEGDFFRLFGKYTMLPFTVSLDDFAGETVKIGFRIFGTDGATNFIDDVAVGLPLTGAAYTRPLSNYYFGLSKYDGNVPASVMVGPVYQPVKYTNTTKTKTADFLWSYVDDNSETDGDNNPVEKTSTEKNLVVTYKPDYTDEFTTRNNFFDFPVLHASSAETSPDDFTYSGIFQAGGKGEYKLYYTDTKTYELEQFGLTVADSYTEGTATWADPAVPYFGYNQESDRFWSQDMLGDDYVMNDPDNWKHLEYIGNFFYTPESPIVIEGVRINAYGKINPKGIKMKAQIYKLNAAMAIAENPDYEALCRPEDILVIDRYSASDFLSFEFKFDEPIVISKAEAPYFIVAITGFRDADNVEYFSPEMSELSSPTGLGLGWLGFEMRYLGEPGMFKTSWSPVANHTNDQLVSFFIMIDGTFPWLETDVETVSLSEGVTEVVAFDSYHHADDLTVENLPEWIHMTKAGRYGQTELHLTGNGIPSGSPKAEITVKGHGVSKTIKIETATTNVDSIITCEAEGPAVIYTLDGKKVNGNNLVPGIYIKRQGSEASKFIVR